MDDLGQVLRDLNGKAMTHRVYYLNEAARIARGGAA